MFPNFVFRQCGNASIWVDRACVEQELIDRLTDADCLFAESNCQIIKDQRKIKVGRVTLPIAGRTRTLFVKRYNAFSVRYKLTSPFLQSGAFRSLRGAAILHAAQIPTASPVAAVENRRGGALIKSFFMSEEIAGGETIDAYWRGRLLGIQGRKGIHLRRCFLAELARVFKTLHAEQIYHNDLKDANILAVADSKEPQLQLMLLDLEGVVQLARMSSRRKVKNLVQINRTLGRFLRQSEKVLFLKNYLDVGFAQRALRRQLMKSILRESRRVDRLKSRHD